MKEQDKHIEDLFGNLKKSQPFRVPENYFEKFAERLSARMEEEVQTEKKRSLIIALKPLMAMAASLLLVMLLVYVPYKKYFSANSEYMAQIKSNGGTNDSSNAVPDALISNFSEEQFMTAFSEMDNPDSGTLSTENLAAYIADNYSDYEILTNN